MLSESMDNLSVLIIAFKNLSKYLEKRSTVQGGKGNFAVSHSVSLPTPTGGIPLSRDKLKLMERSTFIQSRAGGSVNVNIGPNPQSAKVKDRHAQMERKLPVIKRSDIQRRPSLHIRDGSTERFR